MVKILPAAVCGEKSPYPTVVKVITEKYKESSQDQPSQTW